MNDWYDAEQRVEKAQELFAQHKWREALEEVDAPLERLQLVPQPRAYDFEAEVQEVKQNLERLGLHLEDPEVWEPGFAEMERMVEAAEGGA